MTKLVDGRCSRTIDPSYRNIRMQVQETKQLIVWGLIQNAAIKHGLAGAIPPSTVNPRSETKAQLSVALAILQSQPVLYDRIK